MNRNRDRDTVIVNGSGGSAGWIFAIVITIILAFGAWYIYSQTIAANQTSISVDIDAPGDKNPPEHSQEKTVPGE